MQSTGGGSCNNKHRWTRDTTEISTAAPALRLAASLASSPTRCHLALLLDALMFSKPFSPPSFLAMCDYLILTSGSSTLVRRTSSHLGPKDTSNIWICQGKMLSTLTLLCLMPPPPKRPFSKPLQSPLLYTRFQVWTATRSSFDAFAVLYSHTPAGMPSGTQDMLVTMVL